MARRNLNPHYDITAADKTGAAFKSAQNNMRNLASSAAILEGPLGKVAGRINALGAALGRVNPLMLAGSVAVAALIASQAKALQVGAEWEKQQIRLEAILRNTGNTTGFTSDKLEEMAQSIANATLASVTGTRDAIAALTAFRSIQGDTFEETLKLGQGLSVVFGGDISTNVRKLGRALENPRQGLEALSRSGLSLTPQWREMISVMYESGDIVQAQTEIIKKLRDSIGRPEEAGGLSANIDSLSQAWENLLNNISATGTATTGVKLLTDALNYFNTILNPTLLDQYNNAQEEYLRLNKEVQDSLTGFTGILGGHVTLSKDSEALRELEARMHMLSVALQEVKDADEEAKRVALEANILQNSRTAALQHTADMLKKETQEIRASGAAWELYNSATKKAQTAIAAWTTEGGAELAVLRQQRNNILLDLEKAWIAARDSGNLSAMKDIEQQLTAVKEAEAKKRRDIEIKYALQGIQSLTSIAGSLSDVLEGQLQRQTDNVNDSYQKRADIVREQVQSGTITEEQGNARLKQLENQRQQELDRTAKKQFDRNKKLRRAEAIVDTYASAVGAFKDTPGPIWVRAAAAAAAVAAGLAQVAAINASQYEGGAGISVGGLSSGITASPVTNIDQSVGSTINLVIAGQQSQPSTFYDKRKLTEFLLDIINKEDTVVVNAKSRQMGEILEYVRANI